MIYKFIGMREASFTGADEAHKFVQDFNKNVDWGMILVDSISEDEIVMLTTTLLSEI